MHHNLKKQTINDEDTRKDSRYAQRYATQLQTSAERNAGFPLIFPLCTRVRHQIACYGGLLSHFSVMHTI